jgi:hypothetical protein
MLWLIVILNRDVPALFSLPVVFDNRVIKVFRGFIFTKGTILNHVSFVVLVGVFIGSQQHFFPESKVPVPYLHCIFF